MSELGAYMLSTWNGVEDSWFKKTFDAAREREWRIEAGDLETIGVTWKRYIVVNDEIQVERVDPTLAYWPANERRYAVVKGRTVGHSFNVQLLCEAITRADPPRPWVALPQSGRRTVSYLAVQLLLDTYVN